MKEYIKTAKALKADGNHKIINKQSCHFPKPLILDKMSSSQSIFLTAISPEMRKEKKIRAKVMIFFCQNNRCLLQSKQTNIIPIILWFKNFLPIRFYVKSNFGQMQSLKNFYLASNTAKFLWNILSLKIAQNGRLWALKSPTVISRKI